MIARAASRSFRRRRDVAEQLRRTFSVYAWGNGDNGQLGLHSSFLEAENDTFGRTVRTPTPVHAFDGVSMRSVATSASHTAFLTSDAEVWTCGLGSDGQLGHGDLASLGEPRRIAGLPPAAGVACGNRHTAVLGEDGFVYTFGCNKHGQLGLGSNQRRFASPQLVETLLGVCSVACGDDFTAAADDAGRVYTWGAATMGRLGHGDERAPPSLLGFLAGAPRDECAPRLLATLSGRAHVERVVCGKHQAMALTKSGAAWAWGSGRHYVLGGGNEADVFEPTVLPGGLWVRNVAVGGMHALVLCDGGVVYAVGVNDHGNLGIAAGGMLGTEKSYVRVDALRGALAVAAGWHLSAAVVGPANADGKGEVLTWGSVAAGGLGVPGTFDCWEPRSVGIRARALVIGPGGSHIIAY